ncbi:RNA-directed DNA polymerase [Aeromonas veronii]|uniref:RNA-directed DNA polymerase n=1 Tax=Aeromonas veronii TaxID=654 RepID=UPI0018D5228A|nr:RNA-directed DNA polymerase [Aeromonas veronii]
MTKENNAEDFNNEFFHFPIHTDAVLLHLRQDMRDDWFIDSLNYEDLLSRKKPLLDKIELKIDEGNGSYIPSDRYIYDVPKSNLGLRYSLETDFYDRFLYQGICSFLLPYYDPLISNRVFSHRYNANRSKEKYIFKNRIELWNTFEGITKLGITDDNFLLVTDLLNYFEHISIKNIEYAFINLLPKVKASGKIKSKIRSAINTLCRLLHKWCFNDLHGLPQNRDASSFIANIVLTSVDQAMIDRKYDYFRYVDDIRIICKNRFRAKKALNDLIFELRKIGMNINSKKTNIYSKDSSEKDIDDLFPGSDEQSITIDNMWKSNSKGVIIRSIPELTSMLNELVINHETQSRRFRFCINRIKTLVTAELFKTNSLISNDIIKTLIDALYDQPASSDQFCRLLLDLDLQDEHLSQIENFITDEEYCIYDWQNYHIWMMLSYKKINRPKLIERAKYLCLETPTRPEVAFCLIYLATHDEFTFLDSLHDKIASNWPFQIQRHYLIAIKSRPINKSPTLVNKISPMVKGTINGINSNKNLRDEFIYIKNDSLSFSEIYNELSPYD